MAQSGGADYLVSLDQDLLSLGAIGNCRIVTPEEFAGILGLQHE
jgi:predicted nucleic acid-binding protein